MSHEPLRTSECIIGRDGNKISFSNDGSMVFSDRFVPGVRLIDLLGGGGSGDTSVTVLINATDWIFESHDPVYSRDFWSITLYYSVIQFNIQTTDPSKLEVSTLLINSLSPISVEPIEFNSILIYGDRLKIISSKKVDSFVTIDAL